MKKLYTSKTFSKTAGGKRHTPHPTPKGPATEYSCKSYRNHQKSLAYFSHLAQLILLIFF